MNLRFGLTKLNKPFGKLMNFNQTRIISQYFKMILKLKELLSAILK